MPRFRLPPPFNDPQDDVVFPPSSGGAGYRGLAPREDRPRDRDPRVPWWVWAALAPAVATLGVMVAAFGALANRTVAGLTAPVVLVLVVLAAIAWRATRGPSRSRRAVRAVAVAWCLVFVGAGSTAWAVHSARSHPPPVPDAPLSHDPPPRPAGPLVLRPVHVIASTPVTASRPMYGTVSIATRPASTCLIAGRQLSTPILRLDLPEGAYSVDCSEAVTGRSARFGVIVRAGDETRDMGHPLGEPSSGTSAAHR